MSVSDFCLTRIHDIVEADLTELNFEESFLAPSGAPTVSSNPVVDTILAAPTDDLYDVTSQRLSWDVSVNTRFVIVEVTIEVIDCNNRSLGLDLIHDVGGSADLHSWAALAVVLLEWCRAFSAFWRAHTIGSFVGYARVQGSTSCWHVFESIIGIATSAALWLALVTADHELRG